MRKFFTNLFFIKGLACQGLTIQESTILTTLCAQYQVVDLYDTCSLESPLFAKALFIVLIYSSYCEMVFGTRFEIR